MAGNPLTTHYMDTVRKVYQRSGMNGLWNLLVEVWQKDPSLPVSDIAWCYSILKDKEQALTWVEKAVKGRSPAIPRIMSYPEYDFLHNEPGFLAMVEQIGLNPYYKQAHR
jgi:hypothetical protein